MRSQIQVLHERVWSYVQWAAVLRYAVAVQRCGVFALVSIIRTLTADENLKFSYAQPVWQVQKIDFLTKCHGTLSYGWGDHKNSECFVSGAHSNHLEYHTKVICCALENVNKYGAHCAIDVCAGRTGAYMCAFSVPI